MLARVWCWGWHYHSQQGVSVWPLEFRFRRGPEVALSEVRGAIHWKMNESDMSSNVCGIDFVKDIQRLQTDYRPVQDNLYNVGITIINHPFGNGLYQLSMVIWEMFHYCYVIVIPTWNFQHPSGRFQGIPGPPAEFNASELGLVGPLQRLRNNDSNAAPTARAPEFGHRVRPSNPQVNLGPNQEHLAKA